MRLVRAPCNNKKQAGLSQPGLVNLTIMKTICIHRKYSKNYAKLQIVLVSGPGRQRIVPGPAF